MRRNSLRPYLHIIIGLSLFFTSLKTTAQCKASFTVIIDSVNNNVQFTNTSVLADTAVSSSYHWLDSTNTVLSFIKNPQLQLPVGDNTICLAIENAGCSDTFCLTIAVPPIYCNANYSFIVDNNIGKATFTNNSTGINLDYLWSFVDNGAFSTQQNPTHTFSGNGFYYVCLNVANTDSSCFNNYCQFVIINKVSPTPCVASFEYFNDTLDYKKVRFYSTIIDDSAVTFIWLKNDSVVDTIQNPIMQFESEGSYTICMLASGPNCADSVCKQIEILNPLPACEANFTYNLFPDSGTNTNRIAVFNNTSTGINNSYHWDFGDETTSNDQSPIHYFPIDGVYKVCLTSIIINQCNDSMCRELKIQSLPLGNKTEQKLESNIKVYPVPFKQQLTIEAPTNNNSQWKFTIYNNNGYEILVEKGNQKQVVVNTDIWQKGIYLLKWESTTGIQLIKIIKE